MASIFMKSLSGGSGIRLAMYSYGIDKQRGSSIVVAVAIFYA
jgi:hypothetical protein